MRNSVLEELRVRRFADIQEEMCFRAVWRWATLDSKLRGWNEKKSWVGFNVPFDTLRVITETMCRHYILLLVEFVIYSISSPDTRTHMCLLLSVVASQSADIDWWNDVCETVGLLWIQLCMRDAEFLGQFSYQVLVVDEAHRLKNRSSLLHQSLLEVSTTPFCFWTNVCFDRDLY